MSGTFTTSLSHFLDGRDIPRGFSDACAGHLHYFVFLSEHTCVGEETMSISVVFDLPDGRDRPAYGPDLDWRMIGLGSACKAVPSGPFMEALAYLRFKFMR